LCTSTNSLVFVTGLNFHTSFFCPSSHLPTSSATSSPSFILPARRLRSTSPSFLSHGARLH
jgi:hypothetical protein